jgi:hypothetical protein
MWSARPLDVDKLGTSASASQAERERRKKRISSSTSPLTAWCRDARERSPASWQWGRVRPAATRCLLAHLKTGHTLISSLFCSSILACGSCSRSCSPRLGSLSGTFGPEHALPRTSSLFCSGILACGTCSRSCTPRLGSLSGTFVPEHALPLERHATGTTVPRPLAGPEDAS